MRCQCARVHADSVSDVLARVSPAKRPVLEAHLYDLRSKLRLNKAKVAFSRDDLSGVEDLARLLYVNVSYDGSLTAPPEPPPPPPKRRRPFYATWWFWTAIAAGAAAVTLPIIFWPESHGCPDNRRCASYHN